MQQIINSDRWVQDVKVADFIATIMKITERNSQYIQNTGSSYIKGPAKSGNSDEIGIYFREPNKKIEIEKECHWSTSIDNNLSCSKLPFFDFNGFPVVFCEKYPCEKYRQIKTDIWIRKFYRL